MNNERSFSPRVLELLIPASEVRGHRRGTLVAVDDDGRLQVDYAGNPHGPLFTETTLNWTHAEARRVFEERKPLLLCFEGELSDRPVVIGVLKHTVEGPAGDANVRPSQDALEASVDGARVSLEAKDEIVLKCGEASITLRRNGRLVIRGVFVETRASGVNRIKGGTVQIN